MKGKPFRLVQYFSTVRIVFSGVINGHLVPRKNADLVNTLIIETFSGVGILINSSPQPARPCGQREFSVALDVDPHANFKPAPVPNLHRKG